MKSIASSNNFVKSNNNVTPQSDIHLLDDWIARRLRPIVKPNRRVTAYGLKHCANRELQRYCTQEQFIDAMQRCGYHVTYGRMGVHFNVEMRSVHEAWRLANAVPLESFMFPALLDDGGMQ